jgi:hypothetical protein
MRTSLRTASTRQREEGARVRAGDDGGVRKGVKRTMMGRCLAREFGSPRLKRDQNLPGATRRPSAKVRLQPLRGKTFTGRSGIRLPSPRPLTCMRTSLHSSTVTLPQGHWEPLSSSVVEARRNHSRWSAMATFAISIMAFTPTVSIRRRCLAPQPLSLFNAPRRLAAAGAVPATSLPARRELTESMNRLRS